MGNLTCFPGFALLHLRAVPVAFQAARQLLHGLQHLPPLLLLRLVVQELLFAAATEPQEGVGAGSS